MTVHVDGSDLAKRDLIVIFSIDGIEYEKLVDLYEAEHIIVYERMATNILSKRILNALGLEGTIHIPPLHCQTVTDIERFLRVTQGIVARTKHK